MHHSEFALGTMPSVESGVEQRTSSSLRGVSLFDLDLRELLLQPSRVDDRHRWRMMGGGQGDLQSARILYCQARPNKKDSSTSNRESFFFFLFF